MASRNGSTQYTIQLDPSNADDGNLRIYNDGTSMGQIDVAGNKRSFTSISRRIETASTTITLADIGNQISIDNASANTVTIPLDATLEFDIGDAITVWQLGAGVLSVDPVTGVKLNGVDDTAIPLVGGAFAAIATIQKIAVNEWAIYGAI